MCAIILMQKYTGSGESHVNLSVIDMRPNLIWISVASLKRKRREWGLHSTRQQKHSIESINAAIQDIRSRFPSMGARSIVNVLRQDYGDMRVPEYVFSTHPLV